MKIKIIIVIILGIVILGLIGVWVYSLIGQDFNIIKAGNNQTEINPVEEKGGMGITITQEMLDRDYPETIIGTINFLDSGMIYKTTITTEDGKVYTFSPDQPESIYESFGAKNGEKVQIQGRFIDNDKIEWTKMESTKK